ncbi:amidase [Acuticoccus kandeliae]|uniref:amidase n=1 Tax=Acuticoccus kandeliae TaxID=2073160 RepID=UPI001FE5C658|nr:amidase [Acuticoccus kandeliae]
MTPIDPEKAWELDASALLVAYAAGTLDPLRVFDMVLARIERIDPQLNAFVCLSPTARDEAAASAERWRQSMPVGPLDGVPIAVKDNIAVAGMPATFGSGLYERNVPTVDELPLKRLRDAGAVVVGKTNTPEFAVEGYTNNALFGVTRNPWNPELTPGGSSGGSVAAVAAGLVPVAIGTDGGGSTRRPAAYAGLVGMKPGNGHIARADGLPQILLDFEVIGTFARTVRDAVLLDRVLAGPDRADPTSRRIKSGDDEIGPLKILYVERLDGNACDASILSAVRKAADVFGRMGHTVMDGELPVNTKALADVWPMIADIGLSRVLATEPDMRALAAEKYVAMAERGASIPASDLLGILETVAKARREVSELFGSVDLVLMPSCAAMPWAADVPFPTEIDGVPVGPRGHAVYTGWVNAAGHPAIALPCEVGPGEMPIGYQLIGDLGSERLLLALAEAYEEAAPWADRWPRIAGV